MQNTLLPQKSALPSPHRIHLSVCIHLHTLFYSFGCESFFCLSLPFLSLLCSPSILPRFAFPFIPPNLLFYSSPPNRTFCHPH